MKVVFGSGLLVALTASLAGAQTVVGRSDDSWTTHETLARGQRLRLTSPNGTITISPSTGNEVEIRAEKRAERGARIEDVGFVVKKSSEGLVVCAVYDDGDDCDLADGYQQSRRRWRDGWNAPRVNFIVRMPAGVLLQAETGNGDVRVTTSDGPVTARSGNGDIDVSMARIERAAEMSFSTGSGRIVLSVPGSFGAELEGSTGNGEISSELPMRVQGRINPHRIRGTLGGGGERLELRSGNGDITIRKVN